jgi:hypothetical protein
MKDLTGEEIMHFTALFCYNWEKEDFEIAFKESRLGWDYYWKKLQYRIEEGADPADAILATILNMDNTHKPMLFNYLFNVKYPNEISQKRQWRDIVNSHLKKHNSVRKIPNNNGEN